MQEKREADAVVGNGTNCKKREVDALLVRNGTKRKKTEKQTMLVGN